MLSTLPSVLALWVLGFPIPRLEAPPTAPVPQLSTADAEWVSKTYAEAVEFGRAGKWGHDEAQAPIRKILDLCTREVGTNHYLTNYYRQEIEILKTLAKLPEADRAEYMKTYKLHDEIEALSKKREYADALKAAEKTIDIYRRQLGPGSFYEAVVAIQYGQLFKSCEQYDRAEDQFRKALKIFRNVAGEYHPRTIEAYCHLANNLGRQGRFTEAERLHKTALDISLRLLGEGHAQTAVARNNLAGLLNGLARYTDAEPLYKKALDALVGLNGEDGALVPMARNNLAVNLAAQGKYAEAEKLYRQALATELKSPRKDELNVALFCGDLAVNLDTQGSHSEAEHLHRKALDIRARNLGESHTETAEVYSNLAVNLDYQGKFVEAEELLDKALKIYLAVAKGGAMLGAAAVYSNLASCLQGQEKYPAAQAAAEKALAIYRDLLPDDHPNVAAAYNNLAASLKNQDNYAAAEPHFRTALAALQMKLADDHPATADAHTNLSITLYYQGRFADAEPHILSAVNSLKRVHGEGHPRTAWAYKTLIGNYCARGDYSKAEAMTVAATASFEAARLRLGFAGLDRALHTSDISPLPGLAVAAARCGKAELAWQALERNLARGLLDDLAAQPSSPEERKSEQALLEKLSRLDRQIDELRIRYRRMDADRRNIDKLEAERNATQAELVQFQDGLAKTHGATGGRVYDLATIQKQVPEDTALVAWIDLPFVPNWRDPKGDHWACVVRRTGAPVWVQLDGTGDGEAWTNEDDQLDARTRRVLSDPKANWKNLVGDFRKQRLMPLEGHLKEVRHLIVLPSAAMNRIPVEALTERTVSYAPSATMFAWLQEKRAATAAAKIPRHLLSLGAPAFKEGANEPPPLPGTRQELAGIARVFDLTREFKGSEATEQNLDRVAAEDGGLRRFPYLHFATHGVLDRQRPMRSALLLAHGQKSDPLQQVLDVKEVYDGRLTAERILRRWKLDAELVTLSACQTGLGREAGGDGYLGFSQALFVAGARSLVLSLWEVDDTATSLLMTRFYENLMGVPEGVPGGPIKPKPKSEALQEAKRWLSELRPDEVQQLAAGLPRQGTRGRVVKKAPASTATLNYEHPHYWSGFVLVGDPR